MTLTSSAFQFFLEKVDEDELVSVLYNATSEVIPLIFHELNIPMTLECGNILVPEYSRKFRNL